MDLIYLDPPFNKNQMYSAPIGSEAAGAHFKDQWTFDDVDDAWIGLIAEQNEQLESVVKAARITHSSSMAAYLIYMAVRVMEMHRLLKADGSVYLHCDPTASHYLKLMLDAIFGRLNFRNEIVWCYAGGGVPKSDFPRKHDVILRYSVSNDRHYSPIYRPYSPGTLQRGRTKVKGKYFDKGLRKAGTPVNDWWADVPKITSPTDPEKVGYPTQKSLALLERIIRSSSEESDTILDPFCGCATTLVAAETLNRKWIGIDLSPLAASLVKLRLRKGGELFYKIHHRTDIPKRTDVGKLPPYKTHKHMLYGKQEGNCNGCGHHFPFRNFTVDHIVAQSRGGTDHLDNLQLLCNACNSTKGTIDQAAFVAKLKAQGLR